MIIEVQVPQLSESVAEGTLASWKKKIGESVARDEILIDIETDKVVLEVPAPDAGVLVEIIKADGETLVSRISEGYTRFTWGDQVGYGMTEYIERIEDGTYAGFPL